MKKIIIKTMNYLKSIPIIFVILLFSNNISAEVVNLVNSNTEGFLSIEQKIELFQAAQKDNFEKESATYMLITTAPMLSLVDYIDILEPPQQNNNNTSQSILPFKWILEQSTQNQDTQNISSNNTLPVS